MNTGSLDERLRLRNLELWDLVCLDLLEDRGVDDSGDSTRNEEREEKGDGRGRNGEGLLSVA